VDSFQSDPPAGFAITKDRTGPTIFWTMRVYHLCR